MKNKIIALRESYATHPEAIKALLALAFFASFFLFAPFLNVILQFKPGIGDFSKHILSNGTLYDLDASSRVSLYYGVFIGIFVLGMGFFGWLYTQLAHRLADLEPQQQGLESVLSLSVMGIMSVFAGLFFAKVQPGIIVLLVLCVFQLMASLRQKAHWQSENGYWIVATGIPLSVLLFELLNRFTEKGFFSKDILIGEVPLAISSQGLFFGLIFTVVASVLFFFLKSFFKSGADVVQRQKALFLSSVPIATIVIWQCVLLEFFNILNVRTGYVFEHPKTLFAVLAALSVSAAVGWYFRISGKPVALSPARILSKYQFPLLVLSLAMMMAQPWRTMGAENEFFEFANHGIAVDHFFRYGSLPILETFDAHMLSHQIFAYPYVLFNGYEPFAPFLYLGFENALIALVAYFLLRKLTGDKVALLLSLVFPMADVFGTFFVFSGLVALQLLRLSEKNDTRSYYYFWATAIAMVLYKLDVGFAALFGGIAAYFAVAFFLNRSLSLGRFVKTGAVSFGSMLVLFVVLCLAKGIAPIMRLKQFLTAAMANQNFVIEQTGDPGTVLYRIAYFVLPILVLSLLALIVGRLCFDRDFLKAVATDRTKKTGLVFFLFFALFFYFNIPRGIVRHSLAENLMINFTSTIPLALISLLFVWGRKNNMLALLSVAIAAFFLTNLNLATYAGKPASGGLLAQALGSPSFKQNLEPGTAFNGTRNVPPSDVADANLLKNLLDRILTKQETYFDFSSNNYYYALTNRKNPIYENQTVLINGDDAQKMTIADLEKQKVTVALMPKANNRWIGIDGIAMDYKYFRISEFIYRNFVPFAEIKNAVVYIRKDKQALYKSKYGAQQSLSEVTVSDFSKTDVGAMKGNNLTAANRPGEGLVLTPTGSDPFLNDFLPAIEELKHFERGVPTTVTIQYDAASAGNIQVFYQMDGQENYTEENSKIIPVIPGQGSLSVPLQAFPKNLRLDCDVSQLTVKQLQFKADSQAPVMQPPIPNYDLISIPRIWAEKGDRDLFAKVKSLPRKINVTSATLKTGTSDPLRQPMYLLLAFATDAIQRVKVNVLGAQGKVCGEYYFNTVRGEQQQAVRLSSNYYWWNEKPTAVTFVADQPIAIDKFAFIAEDASFQKSYDSAHLALSAITDNNWYGGVGLMLNAVLMDKSDEVLQALQGAKKIVLSDGSQMSIAKYYPTGNYITIEIVEPVAQFKEKAASPNSIKIIK